MYYLQWIITNNTINKNYLQNCLHNVNYLQDMEK